MFCMRAARQHAVGEALSCVQGFADLGTSSGPHTPQPLQAQQSAADAVGEATQSRGACDAGGRKDFERVGQRRTGEACEDRPVRAALSHPPALPSPRVRMQRAFEGPGGVLAHCSPLAHPVPSLRSPEPEGVGACSSEPQGTLAVARLYAPPARNAEEAAFGSPLSLARARIPGHARPRRPPRAVRRARFGGFGICIAVAREGDGTSESEASRDGGAALGSCHDMVTVWWGRAGKTTASEGPELAATGASALAKTRDQPATDRSVLERATRQTSTTTLTTDTTRTTSALAQPKTERHDRDTRQEARDTT